MKINANILPEKIGEECGIFGVTGAPNGEAAGVVYNGLLALQHRGQESAGIAVTDGRKLVCYKDKGLAAEVFSNGVLNEMPESVSAIGHVRYSTTGSNTRDNAQPIVTEYFRGRIAVAHNGNVINAAAIRSELVKKGALFTTSSDSEVISALIADAVLSCGDLHKAAAIAARQLKGAFSLVILSEDSLIALRDPAGFRPLCMGKNKDGMIAFASESCALDAAGAEFIRDILPGEIVSIRPNGLQSEIYAKTDRRGLCIFEMVYFARTDTVMDTVSVYKARIRSGRELARECPAKADIVCGVPDSGLEAAQGYAEESGIPFGQAFVKNRYIGRSFIFPSQLQRETAVRIKLNPLRANISGKRIVLVDDSIVRGTTSAKIVSVLRDAGAKEVHLRISSPPFIHSCHFGTDIDAEEHLIANKHTLSEITDCIGADSLGYISVDGLKRACEGCSFGYCTGCFNGNYPVDPDKEHYKGQFEKYKI